MAAALSPEILTIEENILHVSVSIGRLLLRWFPGAFSISSSVCDYRSVRIIPYLKGKRVISCIYPVSAPLVPGNTGRLVISDSFVKASTPSSNETKGEAGLWIGDVMC